uniref:Carboxylic ester hydrolase n=1 Tax=Culicoides sonorensis TaxID=179676 RepID=A0A336LTK4_CULSO
MTILNTKLGKIRGSTLTTWKNTEFYAYRGIPYATPPLKELRFKAPNPIKPWTNILDSTMDGPMCPQPRKSSQECSEDCLRINVYTKNLANTLKPVLVYIHGGGLYVGSGLSSDNGGPEYLMEHDIVLVTFNYRLGFLGFYNLGTKDYPGNAGFKDQVLALRWIRDNIEEFGGDSKKVTLIGNSAGALCVLLHTISPMSNGLFHQAILSSGGINFQTEVISDQRYLIERQAKILGITFKNDNELNTAFKNLPVDRLVETLYENFEFGHDNPIFLWSYVIEKDFGQERFLSEDPRVSLANGRFMKIPIIAGVTENELTTSAVNILQSKKLSHDFIMNFSTVAPICFGYELNSKRSKLITDTLKHAYKIPDVLTIETSLSPLSKLFSDSMIGFANHRAIKIFRQFNSVYQYKFSYVGQYSFLYFPHDKPFGAEHCDDFIYLFVNQRYCRMFNKNDEEAKIIDRLTSYVVNFVIYGNPNIQNEPEWQKNTDQKEYYYEIGAKCELKNKLFIERYEIWEKLFPIEDFRA